MGKKKNGGASQRPFFETLGISLFKVKRLFFVFEHCKGSFFF